MSRPRFRWNCAIQSKPLKQALTSVIALDIEIQCHLPGSEMSCQPLGSVRDCILCTMALSNGKGGEKKFPVIKLSTPGPSTLFAASVAAVSSANGSVGPFGAKLSNDSADSVGGGESELLVEGEGWLYTSVSKAFDAGSGVFVAEVLGARR